jgi:Cysteine dioxygenase type I
LGGREGLKAVAPCPPSLPAPGARTYVRLQYTPTHDVWLIRWGPGGAIRLHDHCGSAGVFCVVEGELVEYQPDPADAGYLVRSIVGAGDRRPMRASHLHEVVNEAATTASSIHVYSPPLEKLSHYEIAGPDLAPVTAHSSRW